MVTGSFVLHGSATAATATAGGLFGAGLFTATNVFAGISAATTLASAIGIFNKGPDNESRTSRIFKSQNMSDIPGNLEGDNRLKRLHQMTRANRTKTTSKDGGLLSTATPAGEASKSNTQKLGSG